MRTVRINTWVTIIVLAAILWGDVAPALSDAALASGPAERARALPPAEEQEDAVASIPEPWAPHDETFVRRVVQPDGEQMLILASTPLNYQDAYGDWRPIEARFTPFDGGFANDANVLQMRARGDQVIVTAQHDEHHLVWQPIALSSSDAASGQETLLAEAVATSRSIVEEGIVRYGGGWSLAGMSDELVAGPGLLEHNVIFAAPPLSTTNAASLTLSALLRLPTGLRLAIDGETQVSMFETGAGVDLRDESGRTRLTLSPAWVYEQRRPHEGITARYRFAPVDALTWRVEMVTPAAWWQEAGRTYPVVWDPAFAVVGNVQLTEIAAINAPVPFFCHTYDAAKAAGVGTNGICGERRLVVKFNGLSPSLFPPGATITHAQLVMAPAGGLQRTLSNGAQAPIDTYVDVFAAANGATTWPGPARGAQLCSSQHLTLLRGPFGKPIVESCAIQVGNSGVVSDWIAGRPNHGLLLQQYPNCGWMGCGFVTLPRASRWTAKPTNRTDSPEMEGVGVGLVIHYRGPMLPLGAPFRHNILPAQSGAAFKRTEHGYQLPSTSGIWTAVGVKALRDAVYLDALRTLDGAFGYAQWSQLVGNPPNAGAPPTPEPSAYPFPISVVTPNCLGTPHCAVHSNGDGSTDSSNFVLLRGNVAGKEARIGAVRPDAELDAYTLEVVQSQSIPTVPADYATAAYATGVTFEHSFSIGTDHVLHVLDLPLLQGTLARVSLAWDIPDMAQPTASVQGRLFSPVSDVYSKTASTRDVTRDKPLSYAVPRTGAYALVLELPGDETPVNAYLAEPDFDDVGAPVRRTIQVSVKVTVCPTHMEPSDKGCDPGQTPDFSRGMNWIVVGDYRVYSPAGFACNPERFPRDANNNPIVYPTCAQNPGMHDPDCPDEWCARRNDPNGNRYFVTITWHDATRRVLAVVGNEDDIAGKYILSANATNGRLRTNGATRLRAGGDTPGAPLRTEPRYALWERNFMNKRAAEAFFSATCFDRACTAPPLSAADQTRSFEVSINLNPAQGDAHARYQVELARPLLTESGIENQSFRLGWDVRAEGYRGREESPQGDAPLNASVSVVATNPGTLPVCAVRIGSLKHFFGRRCDAQQWDAYFNASPMGGVFDRFRNDGGYIRQDPKLGGAWAPAVYIILPFGAGASSDDALDACGGYCGDIRAVDDTWSKPNRAWKMPDVNINQLPPPGASAAMSQAMADTDVGFSFKTFGARVTIEERPCPGSSSNQRVQVIHGETSLSMPGLGSAGGGVQAEFDLCESSLRSVKMSFRPPLPGIPIAYPPVMYVTLFQGIVDINPDFARITLNIGFYVGVGAPRLINGVGSVIIDTRGRFDLRMNGRVMGIADSDGGMWVAWKQLDIGASIDNTVPNAEEWILRGFMYMHMWLGQGWQHRYHWLPDDQRLHFTAAYQTMARLPIESGALIDKFPLVIPPFDFTLRDEMQLAFGQFCAGDDCSQFKTGMKAKRKIMDYDVGVYVDLDCTSANKAVMALAVIAPPIILGCTRFIIASDAHVLIDQYGEEGPLPPLQAAGSGDAVPLRVGNQPVAEALQRRTVNDPAAATVVVDLPEVKKEITSGFIAALAWARGAPTLTLIRPDGVEITPASAAAFDLSVTVTDQQVLLVASSPMPGVWRARIDNATPQDDYHLAYFANRSTPTLQFTQPAVPVSRDAANPTYRIEWTPPPHADKLRLSLFYTSPNAETLNEAQQVGGVIIQNIDPSTGFYDWDLRALTAGDYQITARLEDRAGADVSATGTDQLIGVTESIAPGILRYSDTQAPPPLDPATIVVTPADGGALLCWPVPPTLDLAEYRLDYVVSDPIGARSLAERIVADVRYELDGSARQCMRLVGLINDRSWVAFDDEPGHGLRVRDASGNYSAPAKPANFRTPAGGTDRAPDAFVITGTVNAGNAQLTWPTEGAVRWELFYNKESFASPLIAQSGADQGASPIALSMANFGGTVAVTGLPRGYWVSFAARGFGSDDPYAPPGALSNHVWLLISDGVDADGDGCADDWESAHGVTETTSDPDGDALPTRDECNRGTRPDLADTDGDGWWDGEEVFYATDPLDPLSYPAMTLDNTIAPLPRLELDASAVSFHAYAQGPNPPAQRITFRNLGSGELQPVVGADQPWIRPEIDGEELVIRIDKTGMAPGRYTGSVLIHGGAGVLSSPQRVAVELGLVAGTTDGLSEETERVFLPVVMRE
ncbi:MAG: hypothetical protein R6W76_10955 [Caldilinea sp.]